MSFVQSGVMGSKHMAFKASLIHSVHQQEIEANDVVISTTSTQVWLLHAVQALVRAKCAEGTGTEKE